MSHGLSDDVLRQVQTVFSHFPILDKVILYGSRAKGNHRPGSDIDLTLVAEGLDDRTFARIESELDDLLLPLRLDLSLYSAITDAELIGHIQRVGKVLYDRARAASSAPSSGTGTAVGHEPSTHSQERIVAVQSG